MKRQNGLLAIFLALSALITPQINCEPSSNAIIAASSKTAVQQAMNALLTQQKSLFGKESHPKNNDFLVISKKGEIKFTFFTSQNNAQTGQWHAFIITPDHKKVKGPLINVNDPAATFTITVPGPILYGSYTVVLHNDSVNQNFIPFVSGPITITNTFNNKVAFILGDAVTTLLNPGESVEISHIPSTTQKKKNALIAKGAHLDRDNFPIISEKKKLKFTFITNPNNSVSGKWHASITAPNGKKFNGPSIDVQAPARSFTITVKPPILFGNYKVTIINDSINNSTNVTSGPVVVSNSYNKNITRLFYDVFILGTTNPGDTTEAHYVPFRGN